MQVSVSGDSDLAASRQSVRLIDFNCELPPRVALPSPSPSPPVRGLLDEPFRPASTEQLPQALLDSSSNQDAERDPFDLRHLMPPIQYSSGSFLSTPSLPIAVPGPRPLTPDLSSTGPPSPMSVRLSSSADSAQTVQRDERDSCGCEDHPRLPPRVGEARDRPRILPIVENGQRTSYTHYWVIPPPAPQRKPRSPPSPPSPGYVNLQPPSVTRSVSMPPRVRPRERRYVKPDTPMAATNPAFVDETAEPAPAPAPAPTPTSTSTATPAPEHGSAMRPSSEARNAMMVRVREAVHGVTDEEAAMILQTNRWDVERAIRILKVEQLFRLGVTPVKSTCSQFLDAAGGDLERASARLLKAFSVDVGEVGTTPRRH